MAIGIADCLEQALAFRAVRRRLHRRTARREVPRCLDRIAVKDAGDGSPDQAPLFGACRKRNAVESPRRDRWLAWLERDVTGWCKDHCFRSANLAPGILQS
jgi:hypothetical protein